MEEFYLRINHNEDFVDILCYGTYKRIDNVLCYHVLDNNDNLIHKVLNLNECDNVEVWKNGICINSEKKE